ncbi:MAG: nicotinate-nucleotide--dimethylbenzimidazole phosphoribosyltransferase [Salinivirgaceae bacterium]|jgi:nicotinate-nucleotide--dimethylbenzimidazole phosphoribosyltransferase|nr:nicotinate-nucleotide--dimethylbenzimidazole phosphoribosyltransferase [Salinivirgaceae bacterium]
MTIKEQLKHKIDNKTKPLGSLGKLEEIAFQVGCIQNSLSPKITNPAMLVFCADHGIADEGVSTCSKDITWQQTLNFQHGGAGISVFCRQHNIALRVIDAGVDYDFPEDAPVINAKIAHGSKNMRKEPAMTIEECELAMKRGAEFVKAEVGLGCNTIGFGEMGIGNTSPSSLLMHYFTKQSIEDCTGPGAGMYGDKLHYKKLVLKEVSEKYAPKSPLEALATFGGLEIAMMAGAFIEAYKQNMLILVDGFIATATMLTAFHIEPRIKENCIFSHSSEEFGHKHILEFLGVEPVLNLKLRLGEGTGAAIVLPIIESALIMLNNMTSFDEAGVTTIDNEKA